MKNEQRRRDEELARQQEELKNEQRRRDEELARRQEELENEQRRQEEEQRRREEDLELLQRKRAERLQDELEERRQRMADEAEEEEAAIRKLAAEAQAKLLAIEQFNQELRGSVSGQLEPHLPSEPEVGAIEKVAVYVEQFSDNSDSRTKQQVPPGVSVTHKEVVQIPITQSISNLKVDKMRVGLKDSNRAVSFYKSSRENSPTRPIHPPSTLSPIPSSRNNPRPKKSEDIKSNSNPPARDPRPLERVKKQQPGIREYTRVGKKRPEDVVSTVHNASKNAARPIEKKNRTSGLTAMSGKSGQYKPMNVDFSSESELDEDYRLPTPVNTSNQPALMPPAQEDSTDSERNSTRNRNKRRNFSGDSYYSNRVENNFEAVCGQLALARLPIPQPDVFDGKDPLSYSAWQMSFDALVNHRALTATDKLTLLNKYLGGEAKAAIKGYLMMPPQEAYDEAYALLASRYGDPLNIANAYKERLRAWPRIAGSDTTGLRKFTDFLKQCRTAKRSFGGLRVLDDEPENTEMMKKLPSWLSRQWARKVASHREATGEIPSFECFTEFVIIEEKMSNDPMCKALYKQENTKGRTTSFLTESQNSSVAPDNRKPIPEGRKFGACLFCSERHHIEFCKKFGSLTSEEKRKFVYANQLCFSCLIKGHIARECRNKRSCQLCQDRHPTSLHHGDREAESSSAAMSVTACASYNQPNGVARKSSMVVPVFLSHRDNPDREELIYAMLDTQSDATFVTERTARVLGLKGKNIHLSLSTMTTNDEIVKCCKYSNLAVRGYNSEIKIALPQAFSRKTIPMNRQHIPNADMIQGWPHLERLKNQLPPDLNCDVGVLIGYDCPKALNPREVISAGPNQDGPFAQRTDLGWGIIGIISGADSEESDRVGFSHRIVSHQVTGSQITLQNRTKALESPADCLRLLEQDFIDRNNNQEGTSADERKFLQLMDESTTVDTTGHYSMPLPFGKDKESLFDNKSLVVNRTNSLKRKMSKNPDFKAEYTSFMEDTIERGYAEEVDDPDNKTSDGVWYLPHFGIYHKVKRKLRVVFDCAAKYQGIALNDTLLKGPDYINPLIGILCRFRKFPIAFSCDVEKMFYAFRVHPEDRDFLRFLWWKGGDINRPLTTYRMTAHLFGAVSSPACASYGLRRVADEFPECGDDVRSFISKDFYVDDGLKSVATEESAADLVRRTVEVCRRRGIRLHKFSSNSENLLKTLPESECAEKNYLLKLNFDEYPTERVLGMLWNLKADSFQYQVKADKTPETRRGVLSVTSGIFDPLGWVSPFTVRAKMILQELCQEGLDWDDRVPESILKRWESWYKDAEVLHHINLRRCFLTENWDNRGEMQFHHFADASERAYGACSYLRVADSSGRVSVHLVMSKARVAPLKSVTIPRLELMAAVIAVRLSVILDRELSYTGVRHYFWTDSQIVLGYLNNEARKFKIFVANRIQEIQDFSSPTQWRHISGPNNPADLTSRGMSAGKLVESQLWYHGPQFLNQIDLKLTSSEGHEIDPGDSELKKVISNAVVTESAYICNYDKFSSWRSLCRGVARAKVLAKLFRRASSIKYRLRSNSKTSALEPLTVSQFKEAEYLIIRSVQQANYAEEIGCAESNQPIDKNSSLFKLDCFMDKKGILRVGGRLRFTNLYSAYKYPVVLPKDAHISMLLVRDCHHTVYHQGRGMTINEVRARGYWVVGLNGLVKTMIYKCVTCRGLRGKTTTQKMADLPPDRAECQPPFTYCGMDLFGPFLVKERRTTIKRYGVIFTCLTTRAVHIEMAYTLTTDSFIQSLRKFLSIRGPARLLRCDNGTNFVGANRELAKAAEAIQAPELREFASKNNCDLEFRMNPPGASHMGGAWERLIGVVRSVLSAMLDQYSTRLDDNSLSTLLYEVAAVINSRPLSLEHVTDPGHPEPLTPNHLLTGKSRVVVPPPGEFSQNDIYSIKRWRAVQELTNQFWRRWRREYLQYLQTRSKWQRKEREMRVGDVVLLSDSNAPRNEWKKASVKEVIVSKDGFVRTVKLKLGKKEDGAETLLVRPVHKLVLLLPSGEEKE